MSDRQPAFTLADGADAAAPLVFEPPTPLQCGAHVSSLPGYHKAYAHSTRETDAFWRDIARELHFERDSERGLEFNFDVRQGDIYTRFMAGARTNIAYNCLERQIAHGRGEQVAFHWVGNEPECRSRITYAQLLRDVCAFSAVLRAHGVRPGDVVAIYLPMIVELAVAALACARIGAAHNIVFAGFSGEALAARVCASRCRLLVTADGFSRGAKFVPLKALADRALALCAERGHTVETQIVVEHAGRTSHAAGTAISATAWTAVDVRWADAMAKHGGDDSPVEWVDAEERLFVLYTSGSTGQPKGIVHTTAGYMVYAYATTKCVFDVQKDDVYWCTADCGWITGHTYGIYGPLLNGLTSVIFEGIPTYPDAGRMWQEVERLKVSKLYTSPTAIRCLMASSDAYVEATDRSTLRVIATVGEPIDPTSWLWLRNVAGEGRVAIVDTYWQTETGGHVLTPLPYATPTKPGAASLPFFGVQPVLLDACGRRIEGPGEGNLCFVAAWPGMSRTILGDHERYTQTYYRPFPGYYFTGDGARRDVDGYFWVTGRVDDLMNVSGHLLSTAEIESALTSHPLVVEAAVVAVPHEIKGSAPYAFVILRDHKALTPTVIDQLKQVVRLKIGAIAQPEQFQATPGLPKTRSGKVVRRLLRTIAQNDQKASLGDTSTLVDLSVIELLWSTRPQSNSG